MCEQAFRKRSPFVLHANDDCRRSGMKTLRGINFFEGTCAEVDVLIVSGIFYDDLLGLWMTIEINRFMWLIAV